MKKSIIATLIVMISFVWIWSAYMEDKVFCTIWKDAITVTMEKENNHKCAEYINALSNAINKEYNNVLSLQQIINQWQDIDFWKAIREQKRNQIKKMISIKEQIESAVSEFDQNLFKKIKEYIVYSSSSERSKYKKALKYLENYKKSWWYISPSIKKKMQYISEEITTIDNMISATDYDVLMKNFNRHLYLKEQITWK